MGLLDAHTQSDSILHPDAHGRTESGGRHANLPQQSLGAPSGLNIGEQGVLRQLNA